MNLKPAVTERFWPEFFLIQNILVKIVGLNQAILTKYKLIKIQHLIKQIHSY